MLRSATNVGLSYRLGFISLLAYFYTQVTVPLSSHPEWKGTKLTMKVNLFAFVAEKKVMHLILKQIITPNNGRHWSLQIGDIPSRQCRFFLNLFSLLFRPGEPSQLDLDSMVVPGLSSFSSDEAAMAVIMSLLETDVNMGQSGDFEDLHWPF